MRPRRAARRQSREPPISFKERATPALRQSELYQPPRGRLSAAALPAGAQANRSLLVLRCDFCERELRVEFVGPCDSHRYYHFDENLYGYVRQWIEDGSLAVFETVKEAEERGYEPYRRGPQREIMNAAEIARACEAIAAQIDRRRRRPDRAGDRRRGERAARCWRCACAT